MTEILFALVMSLGWMSQEAVPPTTPPVQAPAAAAPAEKVEVCAVVRTPKAYFGHYLEVSGIVLGTETEKLVLSSPDCETGIPLGFSSEARAHEDVQALFAAIGRENRGATDKDVRADFEGSLIVNEQGEIVRLQVDRLNSLRFPKR